MLACSLAKDVSPLVGKQQQEGPHALAARAIVRLAASGGGA